MNRCQAFGCSDVIASKISPHWSQKYVFEVQGHEAVSFQQEFNPFVYRATMQLNGHNGHSLDRRLAVAVQPP